MSALAFWIAWNKGPVHWLLSKEKAGRDGIDAKEQVVGEGVALRHHVELLSASEKSQAVRWPDLIYFDCYAYYHEVMDRMQGVSEGEKKFRRWRLTDYTLKKPGRLV